MNRLESVSVICVAVMCALPCFAAQNLIKLRCASSDKERFPHVVVEAILVDLKRGIAAEKMFGQWQVVPVDVSADRISIRYEPESWLSQTIGRFDGRFSYFNHSSMKEIWSGECTLDENLTWPEARY